MRKKHCVTCTCYQKKEPRHTCRNCGTKKYEHLMQPDYILKGAWGGKTGWVCQDKTRCVENENYN